MYCIQCGAEIKEEYNFCIGCGKTLPHKEVAPADQEKFKEKKKEASLRKRLLILGVLSLALPLLSAFFLIKTDLPADEQPLLQASYVISGFVFFFFIISLIQAFFRGLVKIVKKIFKK
jgi:predicted nucleic acid-binding Zn ribbon protein